MSEEQIQHKLFSVDELLRRIAFWRTMGDRIVFTNGCFDILHPGHLHLLAGCADLGERIIVGLNADVSVTHLKGGGRPVNPQQSRAEMLAALIYTDAVVLFGEDTPEKLIQAIQPDVLVKGGDWPIDQIAGADFVQKKGGRVLTIPYLKGYSTTSIIGRF